MNKYKADLRDNIKKYFINHETWNTPHFSFRDNDIAMDIFGYNTPVTKNQIYSTIRYISLTAEDGIADRMARLNEDFYTAKEYMKFKCTKPLLVKIRGWGWREPDFEELDDDQKKRLGHHEASVVFSRRRTKRIEEMKKIQLGM